ncbi:Chaperone of endosialidase, partial [Ekhidna lutea]
STTNEIQDLNLSGNDLTITGNGAATTIDLSAYLDDTDTQLTEAEVDAFVANNGYLTTEADGSTTNEIQDLNLSGNDLTITGNGAATTIDLSAYLDNTDTNLTEAEVDAFVANNGYLTTEADGSTTNEIQDLNLSGNDLTITGNGAATTIDLSAYLDDTDTNLTEAEVDTFVANNGYLTTEADGSTTNEIQDLTFTSGIIALSNDPGATTIDLSGYDSNASDDFNGDYNSLLNKPTLGSLAALSTITTAEITNSTINAADINATVAGDGLAGGAGTSLSVQLNSFSGLEISNDTLRMQDVFASPGTRSIAVTGSITIDKKGRVTAVNGTPSDRRLKEQINPLSGALDKIDSLGAYTYYYKNGNFDKSLQYGFIAQELESVYPDLVEENDGFKSIKFGFVVPILFQAVKEQKEVISSLNEEVESNQIEIKDLNERMAELEEKMALLLGKSQE